MTETLYKEASPERFSVTFHITVYDGNNIAELASDIALEQSVEIPADCVPAEIIEQGIVGQIETVEKLPAVQNQYRVFISYRCDSTAYSIPQFLNLLYGNISIKRGIKITDLALPERLLKAFGGPGYGIEGIRSLTGVYNRPLASTALKPVGLSSSQLARLASDYARGGLDIIKEDHNMSDVVYHPFAERVARIQEAITETNTRTGGNTLYFPMVNGGFDIIEKQFALVKSLGIKGVLMAPMLVGPDTVRTLARRYDLAIMAHPAFTGTHFHDRSHGITPAVLLGTIFRLAGADISIFPNNGGRFGFTRQECQDLAEALRKPLGEIKPAFPCPAGGMKLDRIGELAEAYGEDCVLLIGGGLMQYDSDQARSAAAFMESIRKCFNEKRAPVEVASSSND
ncbi:MAG TPA: RuBisCO large subunit C-terminal-like domain-containing protein [Chloroflexia bacterium]|nr:RuBisCO large subunit C-terminal-like domain-containing protein [Chloroflexia bacterium]